MSNLLFKKLLKAGIQTTVHYKPLHRFSIFQNTVNNKMKFPITEKIYNEILSLPLYPQITKSEQDRVINCIIDKNNL